MDSARKWMYFPIPVHDKFRTWQSLETPSSTPGWDRHERQLNFLWKIELSTTFTRNVFWFNRYFLQHSVLKWIYFPNQCIIIFWTWQRLKPLASLLGKTDICVHQVFCSKFNAQQLLFKAFLDTRCIFCSIQP